MSHAWMPLYVADYLADTGHLSTLEHGAYMLLIMHYWQTGGLPDDDRKLARIARLQLDQWQEIRDTIRFLFEKSGRDGFTPAEHARGYGSRKAVRPAIPLEVRRAVIERDGFICVYCGDAEGPFQLDHRTPWIRRGKHTVENLCVSCRFCNASKGSLTDEEFLIWREGQRCP